MYAKDPYEPYYQYLINKPEKVGLNHYDDPKAFTEYSNIMQDNYKNIDEHNIDREREILIVFDDMIADMINDEKDVGLNTTHLFVMKIRKERELQQIALNNSSDINCKDFIKIYKKCTFESYSFSVNDATLASDNPLRFRKNLLITSWQLMIRLEMKNCNMILKEKLPKYQLYHQSKLIEMNILLLSKYYHLINNK